jgi:hypothetical protein
MSASDSESDELQENQGVNEDEEAGDDLPEAGAEEAQDEEDPPAKRAKHTWAAGSGFELIMIAIPSAPACTPAMYAGCTGRAP